MTRDLLLVKRHLLGLVFALVGATALLAGCGATIPASAQPGQTATVATQATTTTATRTVGSAAACPTPAATPTLQQTSTPTPNRAEWGTPAPPATPHTLSVDRIVDLSPNTPLADKWEVIFRSPSGEYTGYLVALGTKNMSTLSGNPCDVLVSVIPPASTMGIEPPTPTPAPMLAATPTPTP